MKIFEIASPQKIIAVFRSLHTDYVVKFLRFAFRRYPILLLSTVLIVASSVLEVLAMNAFIPLSEISVGKVISGHNPLVALLAFLQLKSTSPKVIFLAFVVLFASRILLQMIGEKILTQVTSQWMPADFMAKGLANVLHFSSIQEIEAKSSGYFITLAGEEVHRAASIIATLIRFISTVVIATLYYITVLTYSPAVAMGIVFFIVISLLSSYGILRKLHSWGQENIIHSRQANSMFIDSINGVRSIRAFSAENYVANKFEGVINIHKRLSFLSEYFTFFAKIFPMFLLIVSFGGFILISTQLQKTAFDYAFAVTLLLLLLRFFMSVGEGANVLLRLISDAKSAQDITEVTEITRKDALGIAVLQERIEHIRLSNLSFSYNKQDNVLDEFSALFSAGKSYAVVGESGAGKSTLLDLILKFHIPDSGSVLINSIDTRTIDEKSLRQHITMLGQETIIFNDTVRNNITYGLEVTQEQIEEASRIACLDEVIESLPNGFDTKLHYRGTNLSGGQRQRVGIARAVLRNPDVLILDESTSALDPKTKEKVLHNIFEAFRDRIVIIVSHDPEIRARVNEVIEMQATVKSSVDIFESHSV